MKLGHECFISPQATNEGMSRIKEPRNGEVKLLITDMVRYLNHLYDCKITVSYLNICAFNDPLFFSSHLRASSFTLLYLNYFSKLVIYSILFSISSIQPGQSFEKFKAEKMKKFDKDKDQKFSKQEVKNILDKTC